MTVAPRVSLIAAVGRGGVIGAAGQMPWHLPADFAFFKRTTMGHTLVMGRATFDSIGRALPGRRTVVITRQQSWSALGTMVAHSLPNALQLAGEGGEDEIFVAGGGQVYAEAMPVADRLLVTEVDQDPDGDAYFPEIDPHVWREARRVLGEGLAWVTYERR